MISRNSTTFLRKQEKNYLNKMIESHNLIVNNSEKFFGEVNIPGDKSITHRAIMIASLCKKEVKIFNPLFSDDCENTIKIMQLLGVNILKSKDMLVIKGKGMNSLEKPTSELSAGNSGTLIRLVSGILAMQPFKSVITGDASLKNRPMNRIIEPLKSMGAVISSNEGKAPLTIGPNKLKIPINYFSKIPSAQIKSSLLLAALFVEGESIIKEDISTRDHTEKLLKHFDYPINIQGNKISIVGGKDLLAKDVTVPADISSAAFFIVAALIKQDSSIILKNIGLNPFRTGILDVLVSMGGDIKIFNKSFSGAEPIGDIHVKHSKLNPIKLSGKIVTRLIDELPVLFIACSTCSGTSEFYDINELRYKESDRIKTMEIGLNKLGIKVNSSKDSLKITGGDLKGGMVDSFDDHRIAMSFAIAGLISIKPITIMNTSNIKTSFPQFYSLLRGLGVEIYRT